MSTFFFWWLLLAPKQPDVPLPITVHVTAVLDGDTFIACGTEQYKTVVRVYGIDAPEFRQKYGKEATAITKKVLLKANVTLEPVNKDKYGRTVAVVRLNDGSTLQDHLINAGVAWVDPYCSKAICTDWKARQAHARKAEVGLWSDSNPVPPWVWRVTH